MDVHEIYNITRNRAPFPKNHFHLDRIRKSHEGLLRYLENTKEGEGLLYGVDTCFGPHAYRSTEARTELQYNLVNHLTVIPSQSGEWLEQEEVRSILAARVLVLGKGFSGVSITLLDRLVECLDNENLPRIPVRGSLGASGDLIPLSYIAQHLQKEGLQWKEKEAIAITNGTSAMTGLVCYQFSQFAKLMNLLEELLRVQLAILPVFSDAFHSIMGECRGSEESLDFLRRIQPFIQKSKIKVNGYPIQDSYIIRCIPQIWGSIWEKIPRLEKDLNRELNSVSDNPVYSFNEERFVEGGLFYGSGISLLADELNLTIVTMANWIERTVQFLLDNKENGNTFPLMLSTDPGRDAGLSGLGLYATHLVAEMRRDSMPGSLQTLPGNGGNQNIVPMGSLSGIRNRRTLRDFKSLVGIYFHVLLQAWSLNGSSNKTAMMEPEIFQKAFHLGVPNPPMELSHETNSLAFIQEKIQETLEFYL